MNIITVIFKIITIIAAAYVSTIVIRRNRSYIGSKIFALAFIFLGVYALDMLVYEFPISLPVNQFLLQLSLFLLMLGTYFFVMAIQTLIQGKDYIKSRLNLIHCMLMLVVWIITLFIPYKVISIGDPYVEDKSYVTLIATGVFTVYIMTYNLIKIAFAIKKIEKTEPAIRKKFQIVLLAQILGLFSPLMSVIGNILENEIIVALLYVFLAFAIVTLDFALRRQESA